MKGSPGLLPFIHSDSVPGVEEEESWQTSETILYSHISIINL